METITPIIPSTGNEVTKLKHKETKVARVAQTSFKLSCEAAFKDVESMIFPAFLLKEAIHNLIKIDTIKTMRAPHVKRRASGLIIFITDSLKEENATNKIKKEMINPAIYS